VVSHNKCDFPVNTPLLAAGIIYPQGNLFTQAAAETTSAHLDRCNSKVVLRRAALFGNGWHPTKSLGPSALAERGRYLRGLARKAGRDPEDITLTLRWNALSDINEEDNVHKVVKDLCDFRKAGVEHFCFDLNIPRPMPLPAMLKSMERLSQSVLPEI